MSPVAVTATTIVSLCTSMPINRVDCSMARLLCLRLHARPSGATLFPGLLPAGNGHEVSPDESGRKRREKGLSKADNARVRRGMIQLAWRFLQFQVTAQVTGAVSRQPQFLDERLRIPAQRGQQIPTLLPRC